MKNLPREIICKRCGLYQFTTWTRCLQCETQFDDYIYRGVRGDAPSSSSESLA